MDFLRQVWLTGKAALLWLFNRPLLAVLVTISGVMAGLFGSVYSTEIKTAEPLLTLRTVLAGFSEAWLFWIALLIFAALFFGRQWATDAATRDAQNELLEKSAELAELVRTLPPKGFLTTFAETYALSHDMARLVTSDDAPPPDQIDAAIRYVLRNYLFLARTFDGNPDGTRYAANVMIFYPREGITEDQAHLCRKRLLFFDRDPTTLLGYLELEPELSTASDMETKEAPSPDPFLHRFNLPVEPVDTSPQGRARQLPGAALAFTQNSPIHFDDSTTLGTWCRTRGDFSESVCAAVDNYFLSDRAQRIKSFASMPIPGADSKQAPIGVVNLHRNQVNMLLGEEQAFRHFFPLAKPHAMILSELLRLRQSSPGPETPEPPAKEGEHA